MTKITNKYSSRIRYLVIALVFYADHARAQTCDTCDREEYPVTLIINYFFAFLVLAFFVTLITAAYQWIRKRETKKTINYLGWIFMFILIIVIIKGFASYLLYVSH